MRCLLVFFSCCLPLLRLSLAAASPVTVVLNGNDDKMVNVSVATNHEMAAHACHAFGFRTDECILLNRLGTYAQASDIKKATKQNIPLYLLPPHHIFSWPPLAVGTKRKISLHHASHRKSFVLKTLSMRPRLFEIRHFLSEAECDYLKSLGDSGMDVSETASNNAASVYANKWRTSDTKWLDPNDDANLRAINLRMLDLLRFPPDWAKPREELLQLVRYGPGGHFSGHYDSHAGQDIRGSDPHQTRRVVTMMVYLSAGTAGTNFPLADSGLGYHTLSHHDKVNCTRGLTVLPEMGKAVFWYNLLSGGESGEVDESSFHTGCTLQSGQKWILNKWVSNLPIDWSQSTGHAHGQQ